MKICLIHSLYKPYTRGGAEVVVNTIIDGLLGGGHQVVLITVGRKNTIQREGKLTIYRINPFNIFSFLDINNRPIWLRVFWHPLDVFNISSYFKIKKILSTEKPKVVMTHNIKGLGYLIPKAIKKSGIQHIHTVHDVQLSRPSGLILYGQEKPFLIIDKVYEKLTRYLFGSPDVIISPSKWLIDYYRTRGFFYESKRLVLPNPIEFKKVDKVLPDEPESKSKVKLLFVGQLEAWKGILFLIRALQKLDRQNWHLSIVGYGGTENKVKELIKDDSRFTFVGRVENDVLINYYRGSDLTIVPSLCYENSPKVIDESLVANVPVITADIGGVPEIIKDDYNGFTFAAGNEDSLIQVLTHFLDHPEIISRLKKNCFVSVHGLSINSYLKKIIDLIRT